MILGQCLGRWGQEFDKQNKTAETTLRANGQTGSYS